MKSIDEKAGRSVKINYLFNVAVQIVTYLSPLLTAPYLARILLADGTGAYSFAYSNVSYFLIVVSFGFLNYGTRAISVKRNEPDELNKTFWSVVFARLFMCAICLVIFYSTVLFSEVVAERKGLYLILGILILSSGLDVTFLFQGIENFRIISLVNSLIKILSVIFVFTLVKSADDLMVYAGIVSLSSLTGVLIIWLFCKGKVGRPFFEIKSIFHALKESFCYFIPTLAVSIYSLVDKTMLGFMAGETQVGYYEEAAKIYLLVGGLISSLFPIMVSRISFLKKQGKEEEIQRKYQQTSEMIWVIGFPSVFGIFAVGAFFVPAFFGEEFLPSINILYVLAPIAVIGSISGALQSAYFIPAGKINVSSIVYFIGAFINLAGNYFGIKYWGAFGAAIVSLASEFVIAATMVIICKNDIRLKPIVLLAIKPFIASALMWFGLLALNYFVLNRLLDSLLVKTAIDVIAGALFYGILLIFFHESAVIWLLESIKRKILSKKGKRIDE